MTQYSEVTRNRQIFNIFDPPLGTNAAGMVTDVGSLTASETWALYWPRVKIPNPDTSTYGTVSTITQCYSGFLAGICARNDATRQVGPFENPAGIEDGIAFGLVDLETTEVLDEAKRDLIFPARVNPVVYTPSQGFYADGARTGLGTSNFPSVGERRGVSTIELQLTLALLFAKNKPNTPDLRDRVYRTIVSVIMPYVNAGALASTDPSKAFFVDVSDSLNTPDVIAAGQLYARIGLATARPAEYIIILVSQDQNLLQVSTLNAANSGS
jgi:phage tail sheath protein FI